MSCATESSCDDALTDRAVLFRACAGAEQPSHLVHR
jgi:hypothetical protein